MEKHSLQSEFIPYEEALAMKELGFDEECFGYYNAAKEVTVETSAPNSVLSKLVPVYRFSAPLWQQAFRWFREKYHYHGYPEPWGGEDSLKYDFVIYGPESDDNVWEDNRFWTTYEEAQLACLQELIKIVKNGN